MAWSELHQACAAQRLPPPASYLRPASYIRPDGLLVTTHPPPSHPPPPAQQPTHALPNGGEINGLPNAAPNAAPNGSAGSVGAGVAAHATTAATHAPNAPAPTTTHHDDYTEASVGSAAMPTMRERDAAIRVLTKHGLPLTAPPSLAELAPIPSKRTRSGYYGVTAKRNGRFQACVHERVVGRCAAIPSPNHAPLSPFHLLPSYPLPLSATRPPSRPALRPPPRARGQCRFHRKPPVRNRLGPQRLMDPASARSLGHNLLP